MQMDQLRAAFAQSPLLQEELHRQLEIFKRQYCSLFSGFGRFRHVATERGETLLSLMRRTHVDSLKWRPPGRTPAEQLAVTSRDKGRIIAEWRNETGEMMHEATGRTLSLRGTAGANRLGARRYLKYIPEAQRPKQEAPGTIRLHMMQADHIQRSKSLNNSFAVNRCVVQWDEVTLNHLAWSVIVLNAPRAATDLREREVISCAKLGKDKDGRAKTGKNVGAAVSGAINEYDAPASNIDFCVSDTTEYNSSLHLPKENGGTGGGKGGAYAHTWAWMREQGWILFFMIWCLSHLGSNEVKHVMEAAGPCKRTSLIKKRGTRDPTKSDERMLLVEHLTDLHHVVCTTDGCIDFLREAEWLSFLAMPPGGSNTRWPYWIDLVVWAAPATARYENLLRFLLHKWLLAQGDTGISVGDGGDDTQAALGRAEIVSKIKTIKDDARRLFLEEMCDPAI